MHDLFSAFYSVGIERKVNTGTFTTANIYTVYYFTKYFLIHLHHEGSQQALGTSNSH